MVNGVPFSIGADQWPGLAKLAEECGEIQQVIGKLMAYPDGHHPDGKGALVGRLQDEIADVLAAVSYVGHANDLDHAAILNRRERKRRLFGDWHRAERGE